MNNITINPLDITTPVEIAAIQHLFGAQQNEIIESWESHSIPHENIDSAVLLNTVIKMHNIYYVIDNGPALGEGSYKDKVFTIAKTFKIVDDSIQYIELPYPLAVKVQQRPFASKSKYQAFHNVFTHEYNYSKQIQHLGVVGLLLKPTKNTISSYMIMRRMPGKDLFEILAAAPSSSTDKLLLTLSILFAYAHQVLRYRISHNDIKPENIMVNLPDLECNIIDYAYSQAYNKERAHIGLTPEYASPESSAVHGNFRTSNEKSDLFSLGGIIQWAWQIEEKCCYNFNEPNYQSYTYQLYEQVYNQESSMGFSKELFLEIYDTINAMQRREVERRLTFKQTLEKFENIAITSYLAQKNNQSRLHFKEALDKFNGLTTRHYLARMKHMVKNYLENEIRTFIEDAPELVNLKSDHRSILLYASYYKQTPIVHFLIQFRANLNQKIKIVKQDAADVFMGALDYAVQNKDLYTILVLLEAGARLFNQDFILRYGQSYQSTVIQDMKEYTAWSEKLAPVRNQLLNHSLFKFKQLTLVDSPNQVSDIDNHKVCI